MRDSQPTNVFKTARDIWIAERTATSRNPKSQIVCKPHGRWGRQPGTASHRGMRSYRTRSGPPKADPNELESEITSGL
jgi:hypothetical protein